MDFGLKTEIDQSSQGLPYSQIVDALVRYVTVSASNV